MKTRILFLMFAITTFCNAQIINFPDANFKAKLLSASATTYVATNQLSTYNASSDSWAPNASPYYTTIDLNGDGEIEVNEAQLIKGLLVESANITDLTGIEYFSNLQFLKCGSNQIPNLNFSSPNSLVYLNCNFNQTSSLNLSGLTNLQTLMCAMNPLTAIDTSNLINLRFLNCMNDNVINLDFSTNNLLSNINCGGNELTTLDLSNLHFLQALYCSSNHLTSLEIGSNPFFRGVFCENNQLTFLDLKCGNTGSWEYLQFSNNPNLQFVCADEDDLNLVAARITSYGYTNCNLNTYCSFIPGGNFNTITGTVSVDLDNNGCDVNDLHQPFIRIDISGNVGAGATFTDNNGLFNFYPPIGNYTITPQIENTNYYTINPTNATVILNGSNGSVNQNFCFIANGIYNDLEIFLLPLNLARPGFDANYKLIYKNKGTVTQSGTINFSFDDLISDFVLCNPTFTSLSTGNLSWDFANLLPFESREVYIKLNLNSPVEIPALNSGDTLHFSTSINGLTDETPEDNISILNQTVVNSFDPNDKTCLEGTAISPSMVGDYVHYVIRFENNGTANAENIVVKDMIDTDKFDINTLIPINASHNFETRISNTNKVEFIFQDINLPFDDANNDGYVAFKIKTKSDLVLGNTFSNSANIYFDYNFPIVTNNYTTTIQNPLSLEENDFIDAIAVYPNPVTRFLNFNTEDTILKIEIYDVAGRIVSSNSVSENKIDLSNLKTGNYLLKIYTEKGITNTKIIKE